MDYCLQKLFLISCNYYHPNEVDKLKGNIEWAKLADGSGYFSQDRICKVLMYS